MLFEEATEDWYAQRDPVEVDWVECGCIRQAEQFAHLMGEYRERFFTSTSLHKHYTSQLVNLYDNIEVDQLEMDWITWHRGYAYNKMWGDSRTSILKAIKRKL